MIFTIHIGGFTNPTHPYFWFNTHINHEKWWLWDISGQIIATSHDLTPNGGLVREIPLFQENLGWWNIIIWPDIFNLKVSFSLMGPPPGSYRFSGAQGDEGDHVEPGKKASYFARNQLINHSVGHPNPLHGGVRIRDFFPKISFIQVYQILGVLSQYFVKNVRKYS